METCWDSLTLETPDAVLPDASPWTSVFDQPSVTLLISVDETLRFKSAQKKASLWWLLHSYWTWPIEIVDLPSWKWWFSCQFVISKRLPEGKLPLDPIKPPQIPLNHQPEGKLPMEWAVFNETTSVGFSHAALRRWGSQERSNSKEMVMAASRADLKKPMDDDHGI